MQASNAAGYLYAEVVASHYTPYHLVKWPDKVMTWHSYHRQKDQTSHDMNVMSTVIIMVTFFNNQKFPVTITMILQNKSVVTFIMANNPYLCVTNSYTTDYSCGMRSIGLPHFHDEEKAGRYHQNGGLFVIQEYDCKKKIRQKIYCIIKLNTFR